MKTTQQLHDKACQLLTERGVSIDDIADLVLHLQTPYIPHLTMEEAVESVHSVLRKREVQNAIITGVELDRLAEEKQLSQPLNDILTSDEGLYGIDEILGLAIVNLYGSIGFTNYGYLDKVKPGVIKKLDSKIGSQCHTFLDDIISAIAAAAASRIAHNEPEKSRLTQ
ncbi:phosphatidylglycerophosphatase A family protein [Streptococcus hyovaginalis]|uniref:phosphatidylglycerophosphatase A family protein n=1 Tax=Streptococcus hyovaginalis TaxID=149015 RepID=UPI003AE5E1B6